MKYDSCVIKWEMKKINKNIFIDYFLSIESYIRIFSIYEFKTAMTDEMNSYVEKEMVLMIGSSIGLDSFIWMCLTSQQQRQG